MERVCASCGSPTHDGPCVTVETVTVNATHDVSLGLPLAAGESLALQTVDSNFYAVEGEHARGGLGRILRARDRRLSRPVAVKELLRRAPDSEARFLREAIVTAQLQHPGIVPIYEAGRWSSGAPFYTMKLISGQSLHELIRNAPTLESRLALLPNVLAVAETMAYAHTEGVLHRDLKPANVMVGGFGETLVVDWGLAERREAVAATGHAVGTPQYLPPEQARGEAIDERADVYALGALLYHVIGGQPPYPAGSSEDVIAQVHAGAPPPLAGRVPDAPPELMAIVGKAMARQPADRYASARELAADLKRYLTGQLVSSHRYSPRQIVARWLKQYRLPVAVGAASLLVLAVMAIVGVRRIVAERNRAQRQWAAAEELSQFMLTDLKRQLEPIGRLEVLEGVGGKVDAYYRALDALPGRGGGASSWRRAQALDISGSVEYSRGHLVEAIEAWQRSQAIDSSGAPELDRVALLTESAVGLSGAQIDLGRLDDAALGNTVALGRVRAVLAAHPSEPRLVEALARLLGERARIEESRGALETALATESEALQLTERLPAATDLHLRLLERVARLERLLGKMDAGDAHAADCRRLAEAAQKREPGAPRWEMALSVCLRAQGGAREARGDYAGALEPLRSALAISEALAQRDSGNLALQASLSDLRDYLADEEVKLGRYPAALADAEAARRIMEPLLARDPTNVHWVGRSIDALLSLGDIAARRSDAKTALAVYREGLALAERLVERDHDNLIWRSREGAFHNLIGEQLRVSGDTEGALTELKAALAIEARVSAAQPGDTSKIYGVADDHLCLGDTERALQRFDDAAQEYRVGLEMVQAMLAREPDDIMDLQQLGRAWNGLGEAQLGQKKDAAPSFKRAVEILEPLDAKGKLEPPYHEVLLAAKKRLAR
jgi:tetratricopeptide (TPR) repeat protein/tRNA A-37 threonylcarbamoyl transferase component Bud32